MWAYDSSLHSSSCLRILLNLAGSLSPQVFKLLATSLFFHLTCSSLCVSNSLSTRTHTTSGRWDVISSERQTASRGFAAHSAPHLLPQTQVCWRASGRHLVCKMWTASCGSFLKGNNLHICFNCSCFLRACWYVVKHQINYRPNLMSAGFILCLVSVWKGEGCTLCAIKRVLWSPHCLFCLSQIKYHEEFEKKKMGSDAPQKPSSPSPGN